MDDYNTLNPPMNNSLQNNGIKLAKRTPGLKGPAIRDKSSWDT